MWARARTRRKCPLIEFIATTAWVLTLCGMYIESNEFVDSIHLVPLTPRQVLLRLSAIHLSYSLEWGLIQYAIPASNASDTSPCDPHVAVERAYGWHLTLCYPGILVFVQRGELSLYDGVSSGSLTRTLFRITLAYVPTSESDSCNIRVRHVHLLVVGNIFQSSSRAINTNIKVR